MIPIYQTIFDAERGDCLAACIASIMEVPLDTVPNFRVQAKERGLNRLSPLVDAWLTPQHLGYVWLDRAVVDSLADYTAGLTTRFHVILAVPSQAHPDGTHAVVAEVRNGDFEIVHDPNPRNQQYPDWTVPLGVGLVVKR